MTHTPPPRLPQRRRHARAKRLEISSILGGLNYLNGSITEFASGMVAAEECGDACMASVRRDHVVRLIKLARESLDRLEADCRPSPVYDENGFRCLPDLVPA